MLAQIELRHIASEAMYDLTIQSIRAGTRPESLMVLRANGYIVLKDELRHERTPLQLTRRVEIRNVSDDEVVGVEGQRVPFFQERLQVRIMIRQCL